MTPYPLKKIGEVAAAKGGKRLPKGMEVQNEETEHPYLRVVDFGSDGIDRSNVKFISEEAFEYVSRYTITSNDIYVSIAGTIGRVGIVPEDLSGANLTENAAKITDLSNDVDKRYLLYFLRSGAGQGILQSKAGGTSQPKLALFRIEEIEFPCPPLRNQTAIADILSAYDDLIENNRRRMALLEEAARQLYREWFVRLRFPGYEHTRITNGVPDGWEQRTFAEVCSSLEDGDWIETKDQGGDDYRLLQISNIGVNEFVETGNFRYVTDQTFRRLNCRELLPGHILIARMPKPIGRAWLVTEMPWRMITAVDAAIAVANNELADAYFLTHYLNSPASLEHCARRAVGATRPRIARRELAALPLLLPPLRLQMHFRESAEPINQQRAILYRQNEKIRAARDLLLPRLMSGEIAV